MEINRTKISVGWNKYSNVDEQERGRGRRKIHNAGFVQNEINVCPTQHCFQQKNIDVLDFFTERFLCHFKLESG